MDSSAPSPDSQSQWEATPTRHPDLVGQAPARSHPSPAGGVLRTAVQRPIAHGFRPNRGCHAALTTIKRTWTGTTWFIEGDISACFDNIDHLVLLAILREKIQDNRFLRLIAQLLQAGYLEDWTFRATYSGTPQGGVVSPLLANIYLGR